MRATPRVGTSAYRQGYVPKIDFGDTAKVYKQGLRSCVPGKCYDDVLVIDESNPLVPGDGHQRKYYAQGVGNIRVEPAGGKEKEILVLEKVRHLGAQALAQVRREALTLDKRAYRSRKDLYRHTPPAEHGEE